MPICGAANRLHLRVDRAIFAPVVVMMYQIEITTHCNFECFYCAGRAMPQRHMAWALFQTIIDGIPPGRHMVSLQGEGEPTTHPRFWDMADAVRARGLVPFTITNGAQIDVERIASTFPRIGLSLDTLDAAEAERIGRYKLERVLANLDALSARMSGKRIHIMTVNYGQSLNEVREFARARGYSHSVQALQAKPDYAHRYPALLDAPAPRYTYRCRYLQDPLKRYYDIDGREYPCCFIKDARLHEPIETMQAKMARGELPAGCNGCREILTPDSLPRPRAAVPAAAPRAEAADAASDSTAPAISIITTCKGRLEHLKQSLPRMVAQTNAEVIVVDYACPEAAGDWAVANFPQVRAVRVRDAPAFNISHARNLGAAQSRGRWLCFVDADVLLDGLFVSKALPHLREGAFFSLKHERPEAVGTFICDRRDFDAVAGYDELFKGWGAEDRDLYFRMQRIGREHLSLQNDQVSVIMHNDQDRVRHYEIKDRWVSQRINALYGQIRNDLSLQLRCLMPALAIRQEIYRQVETTLRRAAENNEPSCRVDVTFSPDSAPIIGLGWQISRVWSYFVERPGN